MNCSQERPDLSPDDAREPEKTGPVAIEAGSPTATVAAETRQPEPVPATADEALRLAIKLALDAGDLDRVKALVAVLEATPKTKPNADVIPLRGRR